MTRDHENTKGRKLATASLACGGHENGIHFVVSLFRDFVMSSVLLLAGCHFHLHIGERVVWERTWPEPADLAPATSTGPAEAPLVESWLVFPKAQDEAAKIAPTVQPAIEKLLTQD